MSAPEFDRTAPTEDAVPAHTWTGVDPKRHALVIEDTNPTDTDLNLWIADETGDGPGVLLTVEQTRELITDLIARVDLIARPALHGTNWDGEAF